MDAFARHSVKRSFRALVPKLQLVVSAFYRRLFAAQPGLRPMFPDDLEQQKNYIMMALAPVAKNADDIAALAHPLRTLGARHVGYGASASTTRARETRCSPPWPR